MALRNVTQGSFIRGLNAAFERFSQPRGSVPRVSNALLTRRGAWKTCDGSLILSWQKDLAEDNVPIPAPYNPPLSRMWKEIFLYQPVVSTPTYFGLLADPSKHLATPGVPTLSAIAGVLTGTYTVTISALDGVGGETLVGTGAVIAIVAQGIHATWTAVPGAAGYNVYVDSGLVSWLELSSSQPSTSLGPSTTTNSIDITGGPSENANFRYHGVSINNTQQTLFLRIPVIGNGFDPVADLIHTFPASLLPSLYTGAAGIGSSGGSGGAIGTGGGTSAGGVSGALGPLPMIVPFANKMFFALGNGVGPYESDGTSAGTTAITNTFTASYPARQNSTGYIEGDQISVNVGGTDYVFQAVQGGTSAGAPPTFSAVLGQTVADGSVIWKNVGQVSTSPAPRGAAHAEVYAGSLWVANTSPSITGDLLDGPSAVRMSTANNPDSWNPLNAAQISRDDGQEITGIKAFAVAEAGIPTTQQLVIFKDTSSYVINGVFGAPDFAIQQAQTDQGCVAPRTIQFLPGYGLCRLTHLGFSIFDGLQDRLISEEIRPYLFGGQDDIEPIDWSFAYFSKGAQAILPPMFICACPVQNTIFPPLTTINGVTATSQLTGSAVTLAVGSYYVRVSLRGPMYETAISAQQGPVTVVPGVGGGSTACIKVVGPALPSGYLGWRIYFGKTPNALNQFIDVSDVLVAGVFIFDAGMPGLVPNGIPAQLTRIFCYDLVLKAWAIVDLPFSISVLHQFRASGSVPITISGGFYDETVRRLFSGDTTWDGATIQAFFRGAEVFSEGGTQRIYYRRVVVRGIGSNPDIRIVPTIDGNDQSEQRAIIEPLGANQFDARLDIQKTCENMHAEVRWSGQIEIDSLNSQVSPKPVGATAKVFS